MNPAIGKTSSQTLKLVKTHFLVLIGGVCLAVAAIGGGTYALSQSGDGTAPASAPDFSAFRPSSADWRTIYYIVATQDEADQVMQQEYELQNTIMLNGGELPTRTVHAFVVDSPEQDHLLLMMEGDVSAETVSFVDLRYPPISVGYSVEDESVLQQTDENVTDAPATGVAAATEPSTTEAAQSSETSIIYQVFPCSEPNPEAYASELVAGLCQ